MKNIIMAVFVLFIMMVIPSIASAQPAPPPGTHWERVCYTSLIPYPHSKCEYRIVYNRFIPPPPRHHHHNYYTPGPRPGHHPPPPPPNHHNHHPGPNHRH